MAELTISKKACSVSPLKMSQPIGGALAFLGIQGCMPLLHGSQGCTAFGLALFVRHFREMIPLQTTAMNEVTTILGGMENIEQALLNIAKRANPRIVGICSTGLTETKGDDIPGYLKLIRQRRPELADLPVVYVSTPDFKGAFQDGWAKAVTQIVDDLIEPSPTRFEDQINLLVGSHLSPGDLEEIRGIVESFGLRPILLPDLSGSLDGHIPEDFTPTTLGGTRLEEIRRMGSSRATIAIGEQMRGAALALEMKTGVPHLLVDRLLGLRAVDRFLHLLSELSGRPVPSIYRQQRSQLVDAMLDSHFFLGGVKVAVGAEPDLLQNVGHWLAEVGCELKAAVSTTESIVLADLPVERVQIGDLEDLEREALGCQLLLTHSHGRQMAARLRIPFYRIGLPIFDRLGAAHEVLVGYRGSRQFLFAVANLLIAAREEEEGVSFHRHGSPGEVSRRSREENQVTG
ncbi:nitrogenase molybdenum-iron protein beta chain [Methylacidimicrobium cyclopophantes]|uniref:Nitrogenase iron-molybdenum cofactor biosynthesis protein NifN n=1 Tax=Methylacidimicrobium cyclopophantes TaxID=1041766 RepID=A0A5E6MQS0_9BACT|nr:nitrogenase iron-molybdenum cofactor biosynthesis protein NifN [Methylacidimicrobium cyclopophantes]VVM08563.1 nitrogenase molybdenum-iron protein beta chain [Methylacidimicrobium cyclopophantes]